MSLLNDCSELIVVVSSIYKVSWKIAISIDDIKNWVASS